MSSVCSIGKKVGDDCSGDFQSRSCLTDEESDVFRRRTGVTRIDNFCSKHHKHFMVFYSLRQTQCCDPWAKHKRAITKSLSVISLELAARSINILSSCLIPGKKLCSNCAGEMFTRLAVYEESLQNIEGQSAPTPSSSQEISSELLAANVVLPPSQQSQSSAADEKVLTEDSEELFPTPPDFARNDLNNVLNVLGLDPIESVKHLGVKSFALDTYQQIKERIISKIERAAGRSLKEVRSLEQNDLETIIKQLKDRFDSTDEKILKMQCLSVLPQSWSIQKVAEEFGATTTMVRTMKTLVDEQGVIPTPGTRVRAGLSPEIIETVVGFFKDNSRMLPGMKDFVSVREGTERVRKQKMLLLLNLRELHLKFKEEHPDMKISLTKFAELRPDQCVLAGAKGTHSVCVCVYHENFELLIEAAHFEKEEEGKLKKMSLSEVLGQVTCKAPTPDCYFSECKHCPGTDPLRERLEVNFDLRMQDSVQFKQWTSTDRCDLKTCVESAVDFLENFTAAVPAVLKHHFIALSQAQFLRDLKCNLQEGECIVSGDFSENYLPIVQGAIQGVHWQTPPITIHPFVCYYKKDNIVEHLNVVMISDSLDHNNETVFGFQHKLIPFLKSKISNLKFIKYFSDGAASQYKNRKNALNLRMHFEDFGVYAEWHFCASCHGKGPCDGLGATVKREAARESLRRVRQEGIRTAHQLYTWAKIKFQNSIHFEYIDKCEIENIKQNYKSRFENAPFLEGIMSCHCIIPLSTNVIQMKQYSSAPTCQYVYYGKQDEIKFEDLHGFIVISNEVSWNLAFVNKRNTEEQKIEILILDQLTSKQFKFPNKTKKMVKAVSDVISIVNVDCNEGCFILSRKDITYANQEQEKRHPKQSKSKKTKSTSK